MHFLSKIENIFNKSRCDKYPNMSDATMIVSHYGDVMCDSESYRHTEDLKYKVFQIRCALTRLLIKESSRVGFWIDYDSDTEAYLLSERHKSPCAMYGALREGLLHLCGLHPKAYGEVGAISLSVSARSRVYDFLSEFEEKSRSLEQKYTEPAGKSVDINQRVREKVLMKFTSRFLKDEFSYDKE